MGKLRNKAVQTVCYQVVGPGFKLALVWLWSPNIFYFLLNDSKMSSLGEYVDGGATKSTGKRIIKYMLRMFGFCCVQIPLCILLDLIKLLRNANTLLIYFFTPFPRFFFFSSMHSVIHLNKFVQCLYHMPAWSSRRVSKLQFLHL